MIDVPDDWGVSRWRGRLLARARGLRTGRGARLPAGARLGEDVVLGRGVRIDASDVQVGDGCALAPGCEVRARRLVLGRNVVLGAGTRIVGDDVEIGDHAKISSRTLVSARRIAIGAEFWSNRDVEIGGGGSAGPTSSFVTGERCHVGFGSHVNTGVGVRLGDDVAVSIRCVVLTHGAWGAYTEGHGVASAPVDVGDGSVLYAGSVVLPGVRLPAGSTVAAGAVVTTTPPRAGLLAGVPAVLKRDAPPMPSPADVVARAKDLVAEFAAAESATAAKDAVVGNGWTIAFEAESAPGGVRLVVAGRPRPAEASADVAWFDVVGRGLSGPTSPASERLREHFRRHGVRFRYKGYRRSPLHPARLREAGVELE